MTVQWLMINPTEMDTTLVEECLSRSNHPGANHDDVNIVLTWIPESVREVAFVVPDKTEMEEALPMIGMQRFNHPEQPLIAPRTILSQLHRTPLWRLWSGKYDDKDVLESDHEAAFGVCVDRRKSLETLAAEGRASVANYILSLEV